MKVIGFDVRGIQGAIAFDDCIRNIEAGTRQNHLHHYGMRIERCDQLPNQDWIALDLTKVLYQDVNLADDQGHTRVIPRSGHEDFSTNTAAVYYPTRNRLLMQSNRQGVSGSLFRQYMSDHSGAQSSFYEFARLANPGDSASAITAKRVNKVKISANLKKLQARGLLDGSVLYELFGNARDRGHGDFLNLTISCSRSTPGPDKTRLTNSLDSALIEELVGYSETVMAVDQRALRINYYDVFESDISSALLSLMRKLWSYDEDLTARQSDTERWPFEARRDLILRAATFAP